MTRDTDLSGVLEEDLCIGCGACVHADPSLSLRLDPEKLIFEPSHSGNDRAARVCPSVRVDYQGLQERLFPGCDVTPYGVVQSVWLAQSTDYNRNLRASSGGLIKEILRELVSRPEVDGAIALRHVAGLDFRPALVTDPDAVDDLPGSIYHNLAQDETLRILRQNQGRFVLVAIPCQLEGIYNYIFAFEPHLLDRIHMTIGLLCGWQYSHHALKAMCSFKGIDFDEIDDISYRGGGPVGRLQIRAGGREVSASRRIDFAYQVAFDRHFNTPRCHVCVNHHNMLAELVVGDAWLPSTLRTRTGISLVTSRTPAADTLLRELEARGRVLLSEVTVEEIKESQKPGVVFGDLAYSYMDYLDELGRHRPDMSAANRARSTPWARRRVESFHHELRRKLQLQREGRYRFLFWRKATRELPRFLARYWNWFLVRVVRVKSLRGERAEVPREKVAIFR